MLPFSTPEFFLLMGLFVGVMWVGKWAFKNLISFSLLLTILSALYIAIYFPRPMHFVVFFAYSYLVYYLFSFVLKTENKLWGILMLCWPMITLKLNIKEGAFDLSELLGMAGLSYISFRTVSLYYDTLPEEKPINIITFFSFISFTPSLLIGPIDRMNRFKNDLKLGYDQLTLSRFYEGMQELIYGVFYTYVCAEVIDRYWLSTIDSTSTEFSAIVSNFYGYFIYLYFDFAGYSSMAIGVGKMMGVDLPINFNKPFLAQNPQDFWRRFHKSLGDWLSDYFFKPLYKFLSQRKSLKKNPLLRQNIAMMATFTLMGCWNGFQLNFVLSGMLFGVYSVGHNSYIYQCKKQKKDVVFGDINEGVKKWISVILFLHLAAFSIYIFSGRAPFI